MVTQFTAGAVQRCSALATISLRRPTASATIDSKRAQMARQSRFVNIDVVNKARSGDVG
jgi:hypothetical protein